MITYAMIFRTRDGMALSASTDFSGDMNYSLKDSKYYIRLLAKKASSYPERCMVRFKSYIILLITSLGVSYIALCEHSYPTVMAYSFLDEIMKEFISVYEMQKISDARRPYAFIEFDKFIHKTSLRYNNPRSLTTQINLSELSNDVKANPPHILTLQDLDPIQNGFPQTGLPQLEPVSRIGMVSTIVCSFCALINFYRGVTAISMSSLEEYDGPGPGYAISYMIESALQCTQIYLLLVYIGRRNTRSCIALFFIFVCNLYLWDVRDFWIIILHTSMASALTFATITRHFERKPNNYNV